MIKTPSLSISILAASVLLAGASLTSVWVASSGRRYVQISGAKGSILDSRTGCVWRMNLHPPTKACPWNGPAGKSPASGPSDQDLEKALSPGPSDEEYERALDPIHATHGTAKLDDIQRPVDLRDLGAMPVQQTAPKTLPFDFDFDKGAQEPHRGAK
jgi:hypothetical protein